jgi:RluA family pseudouridine synthase
LFAKKEKIMSITTLSIKSKNDETTLLDFVARHLNISKKKAKKILDNRNVFVNRRRTWMARHQLKCGDVVEIVAAPQQKTQKISVPILYQDEYYMIVNKPAGLITNGKSSLESLLRSKHGNNSLIAVHRLDKDTSGCLIVAMSRKAMNRLIPSFQEKAVKKIYHGIVRGKVPKKKNTIRIPLDGHEAITDLTTLDSNNNASHLLLQAHTGRTHQIRKHLSAIKHPILGDNYYGTRTKATDRTILIPRQMLHAHKLQFVNPFTNAKIHATAPLPRDFRRCLNSLNLS